MNYTQLSAAISAYTENTEADFIAEIPVFVQQAEQRIYNTVQFPSLRKNVTGTLTAGNKYLSCPSDFLAVYSLATYPPTTETTTYTYTKGVDYVSAHIAQGNLNFFGLTVDLPTIVYGDPVLIDGVTAYTAISGGGPGASSIRIEPSLDIIPDVVSVVITTTRELPPGDYTYLLNKDVNFIRQAYPLATDTAAPQYYALFGPTVTLASAVTNELSFIVGPTPDVAYGVELHYYYYPESIVTAQTTWLGDNFDSVLLYGSLVEAYTYMKGETDMMTLYNQKYQEALGLAKRLGDGMERQDAYRSGQFRQKVT